MKKEVGYINSIIVDSKLNILDIFKKPKFKSIEINKMIEKIILSNFKSRFFFIKKNL